MQIETKSAVRVSEFALTPSKLKPNSLRSGMNVNTNFTNGLGLGLDYNFKSKDYTANASYDLNNIGGKKWANASLGISASKNGHASASVSYNNNDGGESKIPQRLRGQGATLDFGNDGLMNLSIQGLKGATVANISYNTNTHGFEDLTLNSNFQNEFNQGLIAEHSHENLKKQQMEFLKPMVGTGINMGLYSQAEVDQALPRDGKGGIDMEKADPSKLLAKWDHYKNSMSGNEDSIKIWKEQVTKAGEDAGVKIRFNEGKSASSTFGKFVTGLIGDVAQSFGFANDGSKMVDKDGVFRLNTCFGPSEAVLTPNGYKAIVSLKIRDEVVTLNEETGKLEIRRITKTFVHDVNSIHEVNYENDSKIKTTWNHPFAIQRDRSVRLSLGGDTESSQTLTPNSSPLTTRSEYVKVEDLRPGDRSVTVASIRNSLVSSSVSSSKKPLTSGAFLAGSKYASNNGFTNDWRTERRGTLGIVGVEEKFLTQKVYNIEVEGNHNYFVKAKDSAILVHNYTEQVQRVLDGKGILSEDNTKILNSANSKDKIRALNEIKEFDYAGSKWKNIGTDEKGVAHFQSESNKYGLKEDLYFRNNNGKVEIEQVQHLNGKEYPTKHSNLDVLKQTVIAVNLKSTADYLTHLSNVLGERGGSGTKYDDGSPKVNLRKDANGQPILHETKNGTHTVEIDRNGYKGKMVLEEVGRTQREAQSTYPGERGLVREYDKSNPNEYKAWDWQNDKYGDGKGGHLRDVAVCQSTVIAEDRHNNGKTVGEVAKHMGDFAASLGKRPSQLSIKEISQALNGSGLTVKENHRIEFEPNETRAQFNDRFFEFTKRQIDQGMSVNVGGKYAASIGHVTRITGYVEGPNGERGFMINDSYGDANKGYKSGAGGQDGRAVFYPIDKIKIGEFNYGYSITEDTGTSSPSGGSSGLRRRSSSSSIWNRFKNVFKFDFF
ncbi:TIGR04388 family protein [Leptospira noguchii]|uniref:TIGR04388 family protein n=1 Tax=Leptospira noguchii TaxID=28182 RepID=UPI001FB5DC64|nr:TIGR04388 family protein [Leptospira noguchii]UOG33919.1 TIGR04388 family protein [Leptospira noguchii]UOG44775.1 TIGR04388 family protein [Leptospira noguchii]